MGVVPVYHLRGGLPSGRPFRHVGKQQCGRGPTEMWAMLREALGQAWLLSFGRDTRPHGVDHGIVEGLYPTPHIHEQMTAYIMATSTTTLSTTR